MGSKKKPNHFRQRMLLALIFIGLFTVAGRLIFIQIIVAPKYSEAAERQRFVTMELPPERGAIVDRTDNELGVSIIMDTIYATPYLIDNPEDFAKKISPIIKVDERTVLNKIIKRNGFTYLVRKTDAKTVSAVKKLASEEHYKGLGYIKESKRYYPNTRLAAHILGFTGMENHGLGGLELYYDDLLYGKPGKIVAERDAHGRPIPQSIQSSFRPIDGANVRISIDTEIQYKAEAELSSAVTKYKAKTGSIIVMNPENGEIYAMANVPAFNPNNLETMKPFNQRNIAISDIYEPGSTLKAVIACGALEEGIFSPSTSFYLEPTIVVGHKRIKEAHNRLAKTFTFSQIVQESSNVGMVKVGSKMGKDVIVKYLDEFGYREKSGIDYPGEARGFYPDSKHWSLMSLANIPFGQGICTTQIQMTKAFATIANDGVPVTPHFLLDAKDQRGRRVRIWREPAPHRAVINDVTCAQMKNILEKTVTEGTGSQAKVANYRVGGKTGTAQKAKTNGRGYEKGKYVASFIGIAPVQDPKLVICVVIDEPQASIYGGSVAAPVFSKVAEFCLRHLRISPE